MDDPDFSQCASYNLREKEFDPCDESMTSHSCDLRAEIDEFPTSMCSRSTIESSDSPVYRSRSLMRVGLLRVGLAMSITATWPVEVIAATVEAHPPSSMEYLLMHKWRLQTISPRQFRPLTSNPQSHTRSGRDRGMTSSCPREKTVPPIWHVSITIWSVLETSSSVRNDTRHAIDPLPHPSVSPLLKIQARHDPKEDERLAGKILAARPRRRHIVV